MVTEKNKIIVAAVTAVVLIVAVSAAAFHLVTLQSEAKPFSFSLSVIPDNGTIVQGSNTTISVEATYLSGNAVPITFSADGGPNGTTYEFTNHTGIISKSQSFRSNLTISTPASADSNVYAVKILASATNSTGIQAAFNLTVVNSYIQVYGTLTGTHLTFPGYSDEDIIPSDISFISTTTGQGYSVHVNRYTDTEEYPGRIANYTVSLPNLQTYKVSAYFFSFPHYIPVSRPMVQGGTQGGYFTLDCGVGVDSVEANFWD